MGSAYIDSLRMLLYQLQQQRRRRQKSNRLQRAGTHHSIEESAGNGLA